MLILRAIFSTVILIFVIFSIYHLKTTGVNKSLFHLDPAAQPSFDSSKVSHFEWKSINKTIVLDKTTEGEWFPPDSNKKVSDLLKFLSQIQLNEVVQKGMPAIEVSLTINQEVWTGAWDGMSFVWLTGPQKGKGEVLKQEKNIAFFKGKHVLEAVNIDLCQNRINRFQFSTKSGAITIEQSGRGWIASAGPSKKEIDPIFIEKWLIGLCKVAAKSWVDLAYAPVSKTIGFISFDYIDKKRLSFQQIEKDFYVFEGSGLVLEGLTKSHEDIQAASLNWGL